jgi:hypothetical protein
LDEAASLHFFSQLFLPLRHGLGDGVSSQDATMDDNWKSLFEQFYGSPVIVIPMGFPAKLIEFCNVFIGGTFPHFAVLQFDEGVVCLRGMRKGSGELLEHVVPDEFIVIRICGCDEIIIVVDISKDAVFQEFRLLLSPSYDLGSIHEA